MASNVVVKAAEWLDTGGYVTDVGTAIRWPFRKSN